MEYKDVVATKPIRREFDNTNQFFHKEVKYNEFFLRQNFDYLKNRLYLKEFLFLNDALEVLGFKPIPEGQLVGWQSFGAAPELWTWWKNPDKEGHIIVFKPHGMIWNKI